MNKVLVVVKETRLSGSVRIAMESSLEFNSKVDVLVFGNEDGQNSKSLIKKYPFIDRLIFAGGIKGLFRFLLRNRQSYHLIFSHSSINGAIVRIVKLISSYRVIHVVHGVAWHAEASMLTRLGTYMVDLLLAICLTDTLVLVNEYYSRFFPNFIDKKIIYNYAEIRPCMSKKKIKNSILFIGRLDDQKRPLLFLNLIERNKTLLTKTGWTVKIFGDGELRDKCQLFIEENGMVDLIELKGWVDWSTEYHFEDCIHCVTSGWEAFGLNIVETGLLSVPTLAFEVEGLANVIDEGETGLLVTDDEYFSVALSELINNQGYRIYLGMRAKTTYQTKFSKQKFKNAYANVFNKYSLEEGIG